MNKDPERDTLFVGVVPQEDKHFVGVVNHPIRTGVLTDHRL